MTTEHHLILGGRHVPAADGRTTTDTDPYTGAEFARVAAASPVDVTLAVDAAADAFAGWSATGPTERRRILNRAADLLEQRAEEAVALMAAETGGVRGWALFNVGLAASMLREAAALTTAPVGEVLATDTPGALAVGVRRPAGVVAAFAPWNAPVILGTRAVAAPLAAGNTVVVKASENAPVSSALFIASILMEAGLPPGALNVVTNDPADAGEIAGALIGDSRVRRVNFTGSTATGRRIAALAAARLIPAVLELGGKNALIVLADADVEYAAGAVAFGAYLNSGQICMSADRILVDASIAPEFTELLARKAKGLAHGDPREAHTVIGPLIDASSAERVADLVDEALVEGAHLAAGGGRPEGAVYPATVLTGVRPDMRVHTEEIFGPVCTVLPVDGPDEAVAIANDSPYGLTAGILTEDQRLGWELAGRLDTGIVHVNDQSIDDEAQAPFGGVKDSGHGRFGGRAGIEAFTDLRWITLAGRHRRFPF